MSDFLVNAPTLLQAVAHRESKYPFEGQRACCTLHRQQDNCTTLCSRGRDAAFHVAGDAVVSELSTSSKKSPARGIASHAAHTPEVLDLNSSSSMQIPLLIRWMPPRKCKVMFNYHCGQEKAAMLYMSPLGKHVTQC